MKRLLAATLVAPPWLLGRRFLGSVMPADAALEADPSFAEFFKRHGWAGFKEELATVLGAATAETDARNATLLRTLCVQRDKNPERIEVCRRLFVPPGTDAYVLKTDGIRYRRLNLLRSASLT